MHASSLLFIGFRSPNLSQKWSLWHARPEGSLGRPDELLFLCLKSNFGKFCRAVRMQDVSVRKGTFCMVLMAVWHQFKAFFGSFPTTLISSQSDIWVKRYDQNTEGCPDGLTERPDDQLQLPFQSSTESFHNKAASGRCCPSVRTVALRLHVITIIRLWPSGPWRLMSGRLNWCTQFPYMMLDHSDHEDWPPDGWTLYVRLALWRTSSWRDYTLSGRLQPSSHNCVLS
jgi:hypothetical protein